MSKKLNPKAKNYKIDHIAKKLAGGLGAAPAKQNAEALLRRAVMANLLWENIAYESGNETSKNIAELIPSVPPLVVANIAIEARVKQKLRHVPLFIAVEMAKYPEYRKYLRYVLDKIITRPDQMTDLLGLYWKTDKNLPIPSKMKQGLADAFGRFDEYQFAKWDKGGEIKLRDVLRLVHPKPISEQQSALFNNIKNRTLKTPDTWEVALSSGADKKESWERLITEKKLPALAFLKNLRNMEEALVSPKIIREGLKNLKSQFLLPLNFYSARQHAPNFSAEIEDAMIRCYESLPKLPGFTVFVVDVSGSMGGSISSKSKFDRLDAGIAMATLARHQCESCAIYATAGFDHSSIHLTKRLENVRGFAVAETIHRAKTSLGGGGIFTRQCLEYIENDINEEVDRIIVFSDSQDCDFLNKKLPAPFGKYNYIIDVSSHKHGIAYDKVWTSEISGWSEHFLTYIAAVEGLDVQQDDSLQ